MKLFIFRKLGDNDFYYFLTKIGNFEKRKINENQLFFVDFVNDFDDFVTKFHKILISIMFFHKI